jgi:hypothetical protein
LFCQFVCGTAFFREFAWARHFDEILLVFEPETVEKLDCFNRLSILFEPFGLFILLINKAM